MIFGPSAVDGGPGSWTSMPPTSRAPRMLAAQLDPAGTGRLLGESLNLLAVHLSQVPVQVRDHGVRIVRERVE
jgi:hypothetical protein